MSNPTASGLAQYGFDLGDSPAPASYAPDIDEARAELRLVLAAAQDAGDESPWDARTFLYHKTVFPQMARWLPDDERDQLCFEFAQAAAHIETLLAA